jgi:hypothetical protein
MNAKHVQCAHQPTWLVVCGVVGAQLSKDLQRRYHMCFVGEQYKALELMESEVEADRATRAAAREAARKQAAEYAATDADEWTTAGKSAAAASTRASAFLALADDDDDEDVPALASATSADAEAAAPAAAAPAAAAVAADAADAAADGWTTAAPSKRRGRRR